MTVSSVSVRPLLLYCFVVCVCELYELFDVDVDVFIRLIINTESPGFKVVSTKTQDFRED